MGTSNSRVSNNSISNNSASNSRVVNNFVFNSSASNIPRDVTIYRYSPENIPYDVLKNIFVGRDDLFERIFNELEGAGKNKTPRFYLIVGSRGIGKSHFLTLMYHEVEQKLSSLYIPIKFAEEEYSMYRASDFFLRILEEQVPAEVPAILSLKNEDDILYACLDQLKEISKKENKTYLVFVENLHEVFRQFEAKEVQKLRSIFQKYDLFSMLASSPIIFPGVADHEEPFYNFFRIQHLRELSLDEIKLLLKKISEIEGNKEFLENFKKYESRIEGIAHLTGGSPRLILFFYELISRDNFEDIEKVFFKILDEHTPYYQEIFQLLTGQRRLIFDTLISSESPLTPKQISEKSRLGGSTVITQLRRLEKDGYVLSRPAGRETYYEVRERLFRLWRDMRQPFGRNRISVFLEFLKLWYTSDEQKELFDKKFHLLESGNKEVLKDLCYYVDVLPNKYRTDALMKLTPKMIELGEWEEADSDIQKLKEIASQNLDIDLSAKSLIFEILSNYKYDPEVLRAFKNALKFGTNDYSDLLNSGHVTIYQELIKALDQVLEFNSEDIFSLSKKGFLLNLLEKYEEAIEVFDKVLELSPDHKFSLSRKGSALNSLKKYEEAIEVFDKVLELSPNDYLSLFEKGSALNSLEKYEEAIEVFDKVLELSLYYKLSLSMKGSALNSLGEYEEAIEVFDKVLELNPDHEYSLSEKGFALNSLEKYEEAIEVFDKALELSPDDKYSLSKKGSALNSLGKYEEAIEVFDTVLALNPDDGFSLSGKGFALNLLNKYEDAIELFDTVLALSPDETFSLSMKGSALNSLEKYEEAIEVFDKALALSPDNKFSSSMKGFALNSLKKYNEAIEVFDEALELSPDDEFLLSRKGFALNSLEKYEEAIEVFIKVKSIDGNVILKIENIFSLIESYISLDKITEAIAEIESIKDNISCQLPEHIENFIGLCWKIIFKELKIGNLGSGKKLIKSIFDLESKIEKEIFEASMMNFFKTVVDCGELEFLKVAIDEIIDVKGDNYPALIRPLVKAVEIIDTKDVRKYYKLQVEEREIVADIVRKLSDSEDLLPAEFGRK